MSTHTSTYAPLLSVTFEVGEILANGTFYAWDGYSSEYVCTDPTCRTLLLAKYAADGTTEYAHQPTTLIPPFTYYPLEPDGAGFRVLGIGAVEADEAADLFECDPTATCSICGTLLDPTLEG